MRGTIIACVVCVVVCGASPLVAQESPNADVIAAVEAQTAALEAKLESVVVVGQACLVGIGVLWGLVQWRLIVLAKNQRNVL